MTDDYDGATEPVTEGWLGQINLPGHRFKQLLVNGEVAWQQDVADATDVALPTHFSVDLPESVKSGDTIRVAFRLLDVAGSMERLPGDHRRVGDTDGIKEEDPWKFMTHLYVGDVTLAPAGEGVEAGAMPSVTGASKLHGERWPLASANLEGSLLPATLPLRHAPKCATTVPLQTGIPFAMGAVTDPAHIQLTDSAGVVIPIAARTMDTWPDGSVRTAIVTALLPGELESVTLNVNPAAVAPTTPEDGRRFEAATANDGSLQFTLAQGPRRVESATGILKIDGADAALYPESTETIDESPIHREVEVRGRIKSGETVFGRFVLRALTFAGQPVARLQFRVFHDLPGTRSVTRMALRLPWPGAPDTTVVSGASQSNGPASMAQYEAEKYRWNGAEADGQAAGWMALTGDAGTLLALVRNFKDQYPIAATWDDSALSLELFSPTEAIPAYAPHEGEAKRYEIWSGLWDHAQGAEALAAQAAWMQNPPGLFNPDYACATGAFGPAAPHDAARFPELTAFMQKTYGEIPGTMFYTTGIRHWGDLPYSVEEGTWRNGYYDTQQGFFSEYLMTGDARWFNHLEASVRHIMDIDVCYASAEHPDWVGAIHGLYSKDHSTGDPWNPTQRMKGMLNYARLTGDRDARAAALGVADSALAAKRAIGAVSVRDHAGVLYALTSAYDETRDPRYLEGARALAHDAMKRIDPRRGTYAEIHGNYGYRGNVPWMVAQLMEPLYDYYRQSGDRAAAEAVVGMAESILAENRTRGVDGDVYGYSHNPHFKKNSTYHILIAPAVLYAYELTGDAEFLKQGRAMYKQTIAEGTVNSVMNCYWNTHTLLYYLQHPSK
jgi:rhamnogalacturonyl hydrolase YesR